MEGNSQCKKMQPSASLRSRDLGLKSTETISLTLRKRCGQRTDLFDTAKAWLMHMLVANSQHLAMERKTDWMRQLPSPHSNRWKLPVQRVRVNLGIIDLTSISKVGMPDFIMAHLRLRVRWNRRPLNQKTNSPWPLTANVTKRRHIWCLVPRMLPWSRHASMCNLSVQSRKHTTKRPDARWTRHLQSLFYTSWQTCSLWPAAINTWSLGKITKQPRIAYNRGGSHTPSSYINTWGDIGICLAQCHKYIINFHRKALRW